MNGRFVVVVGPDGVGKTTVAALLLERHAGPTRYFHFRAPVRGRLGTAPDTSTPPQPKTSATGWRPGGWARLALSFVRAWLAHLTSVRPAMRQGCLVVGDRWIYGYVGQPRSLRYYGPTWLAALAMRCLPMPDLVASLTAAPEVVVGRKPELTVQEADEEMTRWGSLPVASLRTFSTECDPSETVEEIRRVLC